MDKLLVPPPVRMKLGEAATDGLMTMFADAHVLATARFERHVDHNTALLTEGFERRLSDLRSDLLKWSFLFWIGQLAAVAGILSLMISR